MWDMETIGIFTASFWSFIVIIHSVNDRPNGAKYAQNWVIITLLAMIYMVLR